MIARSAVVVRNDTLVTAAVGDEVVMMDIDSGTFYLLDDIGSFLWSRLATPTRVADLLGTIQEHYDVSPAQCESDVTDLLDRMRDRGLVRIDG